MSLPTGTVTFLFTDIEGSTKLWESHPEAMRVALERHDALLRDAIERNKGYLFKTVGDAFCAAFHTAREALNAALEAHLALAAEEWGETDPLRVRMGLHTGAAEERDTDYFGQTLNRTARLQGVAHGQQTLLSQAACELVRGSLPSYATLSDLGLHRLKDLASPEHVWQLNYPDLPSEFPPLKSLDHLPTNLPVQLTSFIGREKEMADITALLQRSRLLTLTGSGGTGKTRLAVQVGAGVLELYPDGVWLVELASLADADRVPHMTAAALGLKEEPSKSVTEVLIDYLKGKSLLIILDNCEHVLDASAQMVDVLLKSRPKVSILASSREGLGVGGEVCYRVPSLGFPERNEKQTPQSISACESVRLFIERAIAAAPDFAVTMSNASALASACRRLDGIPLAIELAAARVRSLSMEEIEVRLDQRFRLLTGGSRTALPRQQTLRAMIDWSYDLLNKREKVLFHRLSVFAGGWTLEASAKVCADEETEDWESLDLLTSLSDKSIVSAEQQGGVTRYRLLETVRQYARERLAESGEIEAVRERHLAYFLALAEEAEPQLSGPEQAIWLKRLDIERENLRAALEWSLNSRDVETGRRALPLDPRSSARREPDGEIVDESPTAYCLLPTALLFCGALQPFWSTRGYYSEGREWCDRALEGTGAQERTKERAKALHAAAILALNLGDHSASLAHRIECLAIFREVGDRSGIATSLNGLGRLANLAGDYASARAYYEDSLAIYTEIGSRIGTASPLNNLGIVAYSQGDYVSARAFHEESLAIRKEIGDSSGVGSSLHNLGRVSYSQGEYSAARTCYEECRHIFRDLGNRQGVAISLMGLGSVAAIQSDYDAAWAYYEECLDIRWEIGSGHGIALCLKAFASLATKQNQSERAASLWGAAAALREEIGSAIAPNEWEEYDRDVAEARQSLGDEAFSKAWELGRSMTIEEAVAMALHKAG